METVGGRAAIFVIEGLEHSGDFETRADLVHLFSHLQRVITAFEGKRQLRALASRHHPISLPAPSRGGEHDLQIQQNRL